MAGFGEGSAASTGDEVSFVKKVSPLVNPVESLFTLCRHELFHIHRLVVYLTTSHEAGRLG